MTVDAERNVSFIDGRTAWAHAGISYGGNDFQIEGIDVWRHAWRPVVGAAPVSVRDPLHGQLFEMTVYELDADGRRLVFAAGEFSNNVWGFYRPVETASLPARPGVERFAPYVPLAAAAFEVPWIVLVVISQMGGQGHGNDTRAWSNFFNTACLLPAALGLTFGSYVVWRRWAVGRLAWAALLIGSVCCVAFVYGFGRHLVRIR